ncbi:cation-efflux pump, partial [Xanthomonas citri pv. citri]|nr:cation-efflux pump [Xanthomonas citri pv. citri]
RTREAGYRQFLEFHMLVPGSWTVKQGHDVMEDLIDEILEEWPEMRVSGHLEPIEDPRSYEDIDV